MSLEQMQRVWDTELLRGWRLDVKLRDVVGAFVHSTGMQLEAGVALRRVPAFGYPWHVPVRVFVAERLEKIGNRMWDQLQERDAALVDKLQTSTYDTANQNLRPDAELAKEKRHHRANLDKLSLEHTNYQKRNKKTDWSTVK